jgi:H+-transporting ATPase
VGPFSALKLAGIIALSDPPRSDSTELIFQLHTLGIRVVMLTGDAQVTAGIVAHAIGLVGKVFPDGSIPEDIKPEDFAVYAGILPEGKYKLVKAFQRIGHIVGMCGDGANDAPALRQAQMGIAVSTATDVAKSAAGIVLTTPGLEGIVASVKEGRITFQRILTYTLNSLSHKIGKMLFFAIGLVITGHAILTPMLMIISMLGGDLLGMSLTTDNVQPSRVPNAWRISSLTFAGAFMGFFEFIFCTSILIFGKFHLGFGIEKLQTLSFLVLVFGGQACTYLNRERKHLGVNTPSFWLIVASTLDLMIASTLAIRGIAMSSLPIFVVGGILLATVVFALVLDVAKVPVFNRLKIV